MNQGFSFNKKLHELNLVKSPFGNKQALQDVNQFRQRPQLQPQLQPQFQPQFHYQPQHYNQQQPKFSFNMTLQKINQSTPSPFAVHQPVQSMDTTQSTPSFFHSTPASKSTFGNSIFTNTNQTQSISVKAITQPVGFFSNRTASQSVVVASQIANDKLDETYYTLISELTQKEIGQFKANEFSFIPLNPPPKELCF